MSCQSWIICVTRVRINLFCVISPVLLYWQRCFSVRSCRGEEQVWGPLLPCWERLIGSVQLLLFLPPIRTSPSNTPARPIRSTLKNGVNLGFAGRLAAQAINDLWGWNLGQIAVLTFFENPFRATASSRWAHFVYLHRPLVLGWSSSISCMCFHMETFRFIKEYFK